MIDREKLADAVDERIGYRKLMDEALNERIPGGASWAYVFGSATLLLFVVQVITGLGLAIYYSPSSTDAWASVAYLEREVAGGVMIRALHHHAAGLMVVVTVLHMLQVVFYGAYKKPREANWWSGMALFGLILTFGLTGYLLPWDQTGYWATKVATSIMGTTPVVGPMLQRVAQAGNDYGNLTLTRFYTLHVVLLPITTILLIGAHMYLFRRHGVTPSARKTDVELERQVDTFWPKQVFYDAVFGLLIVGFAFFLAFKVGAPLQAPADPSSNFIARPEWYFLFLFQLLKYFEGPLQVVGTIIIPGLAATFLVLLPLIDRGPSRRAKHRRRYLAIMGLGLGAVVGLTVQAVLHDKADATIAEQKLRADREAARAKELAADGVPPQGAAYMMAHDPLTRGERLFERHCRSCHVLDGRGPDEPKGPELTGYGSAAWIRQVLRDPDSQRLFGRTPVHGMESYAKLTEIELKALVDAVRARRLADPPSVEDQTPLLETHKCTSCHDFEERYALEGPALFDYQSRGWVKAVIADPSADWLYGELNDMPAFSKRLSDEDLEALTTFVLSLEARGVRSAWPWVDDPGEVPSERTYTSTSTGKR